MDKHKLIKAINAKGLSNSLISIYYNIGRALPFRAQRFPDGRISKWYRSQFVEVYSVKPSGKGGRYGDAYAYGFYYRNGERADAWENDPEHSWCKEIDSEPQSVPCAACGSWVLLDILGEPTSEPTMVYGLNDKLEFGKHKGKTAREVYFSEPSYFAWIDNGDFTLDTKRQFALLKAQFEAEKKAAYAEKTRTSAPRTKGYTPFESLGDLFSQNND